MENWKLQTHREAKHYMSWHTPNYSIKANKVALKTLKKKNRERERERERAMLLGKFNMYFHSATRALAIVF
jgi:hypothetical protein